MAYFGILCKRGYANLYVNRWYLKCQSIYIMIFYYTVCTILGDS